MNFNVLLTSLFDFKDSIKSFNFIHFYPLLSLNTKYILMRSDLLYSSNLKYKIVQPNLLEVSCMKEKVCMNAQFNTVRDDLFSTYAKFSKKLTFLTPWYTYVSMNPKSNPAFLLTMNTTIVRFSQILSKY